MWTKPESDYKAQIDAINTKDTAQDALITSAQTAATTNATNLTNHQNSTTAHDASKLTYSGLATGATVKDAIDFEHTRLTNAITAGSPTEVADMRLSGVTGVTSANAGARVDADVQFLQDVRADIERQRSYSGVVDYGLITVGIKGSTEGNGRVDTTDSTTHALYPNTFFLKKFNAILNGYKPLVNNFNYAGSNNYNQIVMPAPPTYGYREDLVFLEAWFPQTGAKGVMSWRIRTVAGVDFVKYPEGLGTHFTGSSTLTQATTQGGNASPFNADDAVSSNIKAFWNRGVYYSSGSGQSANTTRLKFVDDYGIYVAGDGDPTSKTTLATDDGYVYAIPLFRFKRRNSGGWRADNPNGARDYYSVKPTGTVSMTGTLVGQTTNHVFSSSDVLNFKAGDAVGVASTVLKASVVGISGTTVTLQWVAVASGSWSISASDSVFLFSDRPDGLYSNIIDASDIIDLRHRLPINFQADAELQAAFDATSRGANTTKDTKTTVRETYGLQRAPLGLAQDLQEVEIVRADGTRVKLKNWLGTWGNFETSPITIDGNSGTSASPSLDTSNAKYGSGAMRVTLSGATSGYYRKSVKTEIGKTYIAVVDVKVGTAAWVKLSFGSANSATITSTTYTTAYCKFTATSTTTDVFINISGASGQTVFADGVRIYEAPAAEYALIDVNPAWTGGDNIAALYPYVDSLPVFVENLFDGELELGTINSSTGIAEASGAHTRSKKFTKVTPSTSYSIATDFSLNSGVFARLYYYDVNQSYLSTLLMSGHPATFTTPSNAYNVKFVVGQVATDISFSVVGDAYLGFKYVPKVRHYIPADYQGYNAHLGNNSLIHYDGVNGTTFHGNRSIFSDAQTSETRTDIVEALMTPQAHIKVTQATAGQWANGDTIKVRNDYGVITGVIDADTQVARVLSLVSGGAVGTNTAVFAVDDVSKLTVGDTFTLLYTDNSQVGVWTITAIDTTLKNVSATRDTNFAGALSSFTLLIGAVFVETTTASSIPTVTATGIAGTWTNLGTKEATYTITTPPTTNTASIVISYSANFPAGKGITNVPTDVLDAYVNGQRNVSGTVAVKSNLVGKVSGNTDANPHIAKSGSGSSLLAPSSGSWSEMGATSLASIATLDGTYPTVHWTQTNGAMYQTLFAFDIVRAIKDKMGELPGCVTLADEVAWVKANITTIVCDWYGYGSSPTGNKGTLAIYSFTAVIWATSGSTPNTTGAVAKVTISRSQPPNTMGDYIDANGFVYFLAYADPSDGVTASTINTDYVELSITLNSAETGYTQLVPENPFPILSENMLTQNQAFPVDVTGFSSSAYTFLVGGASIAIGQNGVLNVTVSGTASQGVQTADIPKINSNAYYSASVMFKGTAGNSYQFCLSDGVNTLNRTTTFTATGDWQTVTVSGKTGSSSPTDFRMTVRTSGNYTETFNVTKLKLQEGPTATAWTPGRKRKVTFTMLGKVVGSTSENPHRSLIATGSTFNAPSTYTQEMSQAQYDSGAKQDGTITTVTTSVVGEYAAIVREFDLSHLGLSLSQAKAALRSIVSAVTCYGSGDSASVLTYGATVKVYDNGSWANTQTNTASTPSTITNTLSSTLGNKLSNSQKVYVLIQATYPASATNPSTLYVDYAKMDVTLADYVDFVKSNIVKVRPETKEMKLYFPARSYRLIGGGANSDVVALNYRYVPYQGVGNTSNYRILTEPRTFLMTTFGTGRAKLTGILDFTNPITPNLPLGSGVLDSDFVNGTMTANFDNGVIDANRLESIYKDGLDAYTIGSPTGNNFRGIRVGDVVTLSNAAKRGFKQISIINYRRVKVLITEPVQSLLVTKCLAVDSNNNVVMLVMTKSQQANQTKLSTDINNAATDGVDVYYLAGRPLVKGV